MTPDQTTIKVSAQDTALMLLALSRLDAGDLSRIGNESRNRLVKRLARAESRIFNGEESP